MSISFFVESGTCEHFCFLSYKPGGIVSGSEADLVSVNK